MLLISIVLLLITNTSYQPNSISLVIQFAVPYFTTQNFATVANIWRRMLFIDGPIVSGRNLVDIAAGRHFVLNLKS